MKAMWTEADASYEGRYYQVAGAQCDPKPLQQPHPPVWIGGERRAAHAEGRRPPRQRVELRRQARRVAAQARGAPGALPGRRARRGPDRQELESRAARARHRGRGRAFHEARRAAQPWLEEWDSYRLGNLAGTPEQVLDRLAIYGELGAGTSWRGCPTTPARRPCAGSPTRSSPSCADAARSAWVGRVSGTRCAGSRGSSGGRAARRAGPRTRTR